MSDKLYFSYFERKLRSYDSIYPTFDYSNDIIFPTGFKESVYLIKRQNWIYYDKKDDVIGMSAFYVITTKPVNLLSSSLSRKAIKNFESTECIPENKGIFIEKFTDFIVECGFRDFEIIYQNQIEELKYSEICRIIKKGMKKLYKRRI